MKDRDLLRVDAKRVSQAWRDQEGQGQDRAGVRIQEGGRRGLEGRFWRSSRGHINCTGQECEQARGRLSDLQKGEIFSKLFWQDFC